MKEFVINQRSYCCLRHKIINNTLAILFIGDSHIEQYIIAIFNSAYRNKYLLIHIYVHSLDYNNMLQKKFFLKLKKNRYFPLCNRQLYKNR